MRRTIPSFRIASVLEEKTWKEYRKFLNVNDRKIFDNMFAVATLYNSASSYAAIPIRIHLGHPILQYQKYSLVLIDSVQYY
jgi:hypothetical protein